jgi:hypothetical protein
VGHGWVVVEVRAGQAAGGVEDHVGGGLGGVVCELGEDAGVGVGGGDDAGVAEHLLDDFEIGAEDDRKTLELIAQFLF